MATLQIRDVPDDVHRPYRRLAAAAGMSLQAYLTSELVGAARVPTPAELVAEVERSMSERQGRGYAAEASAEHVREARDAR